MNPNPGTNNMPNTLTRLQQMGQTYAVLNNDHGGRLIILEKGARALDLKAVEDEPSAFWHDLNALHDDKNWNSGGDRTWLSPELDYFQDSSGIYHVPEHLDPGSWKLTQLSQSHAVANMTCDLQHSGSSKKIRIDLDKRYTLVPNPFLMNHSSLFPDCPSVSHVGFEVYTEINLTPLHSVPLTESFASPPGYCNLWIIAKCRLRVRFQLQRTARCVQ
ncbi:hypothetical protein [Paenibacillus luteus]|uniref:hypothetical protein n=1 Tax=Paenibacillus luteus TaxID=2545753 RepID=UPI0019D584C8|nr:hypothetical protein [Paenibacillus luteus]